MQKIWIPSPPFLLRKSLLKTILKQESIKNKSCLEIGYGSGHMLNFLYNMGFLCYGFDFSSQAYFSAEKNIFYNNIPYNKIILLKDEIEIFNRKYDYIISFEVMEHIENDNEAICKWKQLLNHNGKIIISVPAHQKLFSDLDLSYGHFRRYDKSDLIKLFNNNDLVIEKIYCYGFPITNITEFISKLLAKYNRNKFKNIDKLELTKKSFETSSSNFIRIINKLISNDILLFPFYKIQKLFIRSNLGSGFIVVAIKK